MKITMTWDQYLNFCATHEDRQGFIYDKDEARWICVDEAKSSSIEPPDPEDEYEYEVSGQKEHDSKLFNDGLVEIDTDDYDDPYDEDNYTSSARGDYSPSCPWNAPGMSIRDFI